MKTFLLVVQDPKKDSTGRKIKSGFVFIFRLTFLVASLDT